MFLSRIFLALSSNSLIYIWASVEMMTCFQKGISHHWTPQALLVTRSLDLRIGTSVGLEKFRTQIDTLDGYNIRTFVHF